MYLIFLILKMMPNFPSNKIIIFYCKIITRENKINLRINNKKNLQKRENKNQLIVRPDKI